MSTAPAGRRFSSAPSATAASTRPGMPANSWTRCSAATLSTSPIDSADAWTPSAIAEKRNSPAGVPSYTRTMSATSERLSSRSLDLYLPDEVRAILEERFWRSVEEKSTLEVFSGDETIVAAEEGHAALFSEHGFDQSLA